MHAREKRLIIDLPEEFLNRDINVIVELDNKNIEKTLMTGKIKIDTKKWKFQREKIYE
jgi:hypothetical protein